MGDTANLIDEVWLQRAEEAEQALEKQLEELPGFGTAPLGSRGRKLDESHEAAPYSADDSDSDPDSLVRSPSSESPRIVLSEDEAVD